MFDLAHKHWPESATRKVEGEDAGEVSALETQAGDAAALGAAGDDAAARADDKQSVSAPLEFEVPVWKMEAPAGALTIGEEMKAIVTAYPPVEAKDAEVKSTVSPTKVKEELKLKYKVLRFFTPKATLEIDKGKPSVKLAAEVMVDDQKLGGTWVNEIKVSPGLYADMKGAGLQLEFSDKVSGELGKLYDWTIKAAFEIKVTAKLNLAAVTVGVLAEGFATAALPIAVGASAIMAAFEASDEGALENDIVAGAIDVRKACVAYALVMSGSRSEAVNEALGAGGWAQTRMQALAVKDFHGLAQARNTTIEQLREDAKQEAGLYSRVLAEAKSTAYGKYLTEVRAQVKKWRDGHPIKAFFTKEATQQNKSFDVATRHLNDDEGKRSANG